MRKKIEVKVQKCLPINSWTKQTTSQDTIARSNSDAAGTNSAEFGNGFLPLSAYFGPSTLHIQLSNLSRPSRLKVFPPTPKMKNQKIDFLYFSQSMKKNTCLSHLVNTANTS